MGFILKFKKEILVILGIGIFYLILRTLFLSNLPIFTDEAIYIRWSQIGLHDASWRFISLTDGKQPLFTWVMMIFLKFIHDPLLAGRLVSVFSGIFTLIGICLLTFELFKNRTISLIAGFAYVIYPFAQVYDRMALMDGMVGTFAVWGLLFGIMLVRKLRLDIAYTLGFIIGGAALTKSNGFFSAYLLPFTLFLFNFKNGNWKANLIKWVVFAGFAFAISQGLYSILRLSPFFHIISEKNGVFIYTFQEWINHPFNFFISNILVMIRQWLTYFNVFLIAGTIGLFNRKFIRENLVLISYFLVPFIIFALFAKILYPRYLYPMTLSLIPLVALGIYDLSEVVRQKFKIKFSLVLVLILISIYPIYSSAMFAINPVSAPIDQTDRDQYISTWPAGWGVKEAINFFEEQSQDKKIFVATQGTFGLMPASVEMYFYNNPNVTIKGYWPINDQIPSDVISASQKVDTYFLFYEPCTSCTNTYFPPTNWSVTKVLQAPRGNLTVYKVNNK